MDDARRTVEAALWRVLHRPRLLVWMQLSRAALAMMILPLLLQCALVDRDRCCWVKHAAWMLQGRLQLLLLCYWASAALSIHRGDRCPSLIRMQSSGVEQEGVLGSAGLRSSGERTERAGMRARAR